MLASTLLSALSSASIASAAFLSVAIPSSPLLPNPGSLPSSTHAILLGPSGVKHNVPIRRDSIFVFPNLGEASYLLTIHARDYFFPPLRVDVTSKLNESEIASGSAVVEQIQAWQTFRGNEWSNKGSSYGSGWGELKVQIKPTSQKSYYQTRGGFDIFGFLKSPMILMGLVSVVMIFGIPFLIENLDPETKAEIEEMRGKSPLGAQKTANQITQFDFANWMTGRDGQGSAPPAVEAKPTSKR